jgi:hypothetical protein
MAAKEKKPLHEYLQRTYNARHIKRAAKAKAKRR